MEDLIIAFQIFLKYSKAEYPTNCSHDELWVDVDPDIVTESDKKLLDDLGFIPSDEGFVSFRFGSC